jgi:hypothetical protein
MTYIPIAIMSVASFYYPDPMLLYAISGFMLIFSSAFYFMAYNLIAGLSVSNLDTETPWKDIWTVRLSHLIALIALYHAGDAFLYVAIFALPWMLVNVATDTLNTLVQTGHLEIGDADSED